MATPETRVIAAVAITFFATWYFFGWVYLPTEDDFRVLATSRYFETMSREGFAALARYEDCRIEPGEPGDRAQGIAMFGLCSAEDADFRYSYFIAMNGLAGTRYSGFDVFPK